MEKLYYTDRYKTEFDANVVDVIEREGKYLVELDQTAFFPGGGGQFCDRGTLNGIEVVDMLEENGKVYHIIEENLSDKEVKGAIDWDRREDGMHQHFGQHILSGCFFTKYNRNTCGFHLGEDISTVDIEGEFTDEMLLEIEKMANDVIRQNIHVDIFVPSKDELEDTWTRRKLPDTAEEIRIVRIGDLDTNACCGCHPEYTGELRLLKIKRTEKCRNATRVEFLAGKRAVDYVLKRDAVMTNLCKHLSCNEENIEKCVKNIEEKCDEIIHQKNMLEDELLDYRIKELIEKAEKIGDIKVIKSVFKDKDSRYLNKMVKKITENEKIAVMFLNEVSNRINVVFAYTEDIDGPSMSDILRDKISIIEGKGGGNKYSAQGGGVNNGKSNEFIEESYKMFLAHFE